MFAAFLPVLTTLTEHQLDILVCVTFVGGLVIGALCVALPRDYRNY